MKKPLSFFTLIMFALLVGLLHAPKASAGVGRIDVGMDTSVIGSYVTTTRTAIQKRIGSYFFHAWPNQSFQLTTISMDVPSLASTTVALSNVKMKVQSTGVQYGNTLPTVYGSTLFGFGGSLSLPAGSTVVLDLYADIPSTATGTLSTVVRDCLGIGQNPLEFVHCENEAGGQQITIVQDPVTVLTGLVAGSYATTSPLIAHVGDEVYFHPTSTNLDSLIFGTDYTVAFWENSSIKNFFEDCYLVDDDTGMSCFMNTVGQGDVRYDITEGTNVFSSNTIHITVLKE